MIDWGSTAFEALHSLLDPDVPGTDDKATFRIVIPAKCLTQIIAW